MHACVHAYIYIYTYIHIYIVAWLSRISFKKLSMFVEI